MDMTQIIDKLGTAVQQIEAENGAPLPQYQPTTPRARLGYDHLIDALNRLPDGVRPVVWPVMQLGSFWVWAAAAPTGYAVFRRREVPASSARARPTPAASNSARPRPCSV